MRKFSKIAKDKQTQAHKDFERMYHQEKLGASEIAKALTERYSCNISRQLIYTWISDLETRSQTSQTPSKNTSKNTSNPTDCQTETSNTNLYDLIESLLERIKKNWTKAITNLRTYLPFYEPCKPRFPRRLPSLLPSTLPILYPANTIPPIPDPRQPLPPTDPERTNYAYSRYPIG